MKLVVLIDADNIHATDAEEIFSIVDKLGEAVTRRAFGNLAVFSGKDGWKESVRKYAISALPQVNNLDRKNTADFALIINAMDCLASNHYDGFVLVSSDSDFTSLAQRIRDEGKAVYGIGYLHAPESFRNACTEFFLLSEKKSIVETNSCDVPTLEKPSDVSPLIVSSQPAKSETQIIGAAVASTVFAQPIVSSASSVVLPAADGHQSAVATAVQQAKHDVLPAVDEHHSIAAIAVPQTKQDVQSAMLEVSSVKLAEKQKIVDELKKQKCSTLKSLKNCLNKTLMQPTDIADAIINEMKNQGIISIDGGDKVVWFDIAFSGKAEMEFQKTITDLKKHKCKKLNTLQNWLTVNLKYSVDETKTIIKKMKNCGIISIDENNKVTWLDDNSRPVLHWL